MFLPTWFLVITLNTTKQTIKVLEQPNQITCLYRANLINSEDEDVASVYNARCTTKPLPLKE